MSDTIRAAYDIVRARELFDFAYTCHLEVMADKTLMILDQLEARRESEMKKYHAEHRAWRKTRNPW